MDVNFLRNAIQYYYAKIIETNDPYYWYYLADAQAKAGYLNDALETINHALMRPNPSYLGQGLLEMHAQLQPVYNNRETNEQIVTVKRGDIDGDGKIDKVLLTGNKTPDSPLWKDITLVIQKGGTNRDQRISLQDNMGYNPTLFLGDFTGKKVKDILVVIDTGGSAGAIYSYVFSTVNGQVKQIFNSDVFNEHFSYDVTYENHYKVKVISKNLKIAYILDLEYKGKEYLGEIYNKDGQLKEPITGWVNPLGGLYPIDFNRDGTYDLEAIQGIAGRYNADRLGYVQTVLKWNGHSFVPDRQNVSIFGKNI